MAALTDFCDQWLTKESGLPLLKQSQASTLIQTGDFWSFVSRIPPGGGSLGGNGDEGVVASERDGP